MFVDKNMKASEYVFKKDVRADLHKFMSSLKYNSTIHINAVPSYIAKEVKCCANKNGGFATYNKLLFEKLILAQNISDADNNREFNETEFEIFKELSKEYGNPVIGGVEISSYNLHNIKSISKDNDGKYTVVIGYGDNVKTYRFAQQDESKKAIIKVSNVFPEKTTVSNFEFDEIA